METSRVPNWLRSHRHRCGFSQKRVAKLLGLSDTSMLSRWERGKSFPNLFQAFTLARIYRLTPHELFQEMWNRACENLPNAIQDQDYQSNQSQKIIDKR